MPALILNFNKMVKVFYQSKANRCRVVDDQNKEWLVDSVVLSQAEFIVDLTKRAEYLKTGIRNNHAFVQGDFVQTDTLFVEPNSGVDEWIHCRYDRAKGIFAEVKTGIGVTESELVFILGCEIYKQK